MNKLLVVFFCQLLIMTSYAQQEASPKKTFIKRKKPITEEEKKRRQERLKLDSRRTIQVKIANVSWNKSSDRIDTGVIVLKDVKSNKIVQILVEESAPDSGVFSGTYWVNWGNASNVKPEVYVVDRDKLMSSEDFKEVIVGINEGKISRRPLFYRKNKQGQVLEVFDTREEARAAIDLLRTQTERAKNFEPTSATKDYLSLKALLDAQEYADYLNTNINRKKEITKRVVDRFRQEKAEKQKLSKNIVNFQNLDETEKERRRQEAKEIANEAIAAFKDSDFETSEIAFKRSYDLDPENMGYYFQYAISLYRNKNFNEALIAFLNLKEEEGFSLESKYYQALCHYELKEFEYAMEILNSIKNSENSKFSSLAHFYSGVIQFEQKNFELSRTEFQKVLETSEDMNLDESAEKYIQMIDQVEAFAIEKTKKYFLSGSLGLIYDSNVLQVSDSSSDQGSASDKSDIRYLLGAGFYWRPVYEKKYEYGLRLRTDYIYTKKEELDDFDPWSIQLTSPLSIKTMAFNRFYKMDLKPGYELLHLGTNDSTDRPKKLLKAYFLDWGNTFINNEKWISTYTLGYRKDQFFETRGKDAKKYTLKYSNIYFLNESKSKGLLGDIAYIMNNAVDNTNDFKRYELSLLYLTPTPFWETTFVGGLSTYILKYDDKTPTQKDFNKTLTLNLSRPIGEGLSASLLGTYVLNDSDLSSSEYDKWTLGIVVSGEFGF